MPTLESKPIRSVWHIVKPYLEDISRDYTWRPEDVYAECLYKDAVLYQNTEGFIVLKQTVEPYTEDRQLHIWVACSYHNKGVSLIDEYYGQIEEIARSIGAKKVTFGTKRTGYDRALDMTEWSATKHYERIVHDNK